MNSVCVVGVLAGEPRPQSDTQTPCCTARLCVEEQGKDGQTYKLYVPLEAWGQAAISLGPLPEGTTVALSGKLKWKSWLKNGEKQGSLVVMTSQVEVLSPAPALASKEG